MIGLQKPEYLQNGENHTKHPASEAVEAAWPCVPDAARRFQRAISVRQLTIDKI